jgi:hypothetical protein
MKSSFKAWLQKNNCLLLLKKPFQVYQKKKKKRQQQGSSYKLLYIQHIQDNFTIINFSFFCLLIIQQEQLQFLSTFSVICSSSSSAISR